MAANSAHRLGQHADHRDRLDQLSRALTLAWASLSQVDAWGSVRQMPALRDPGLQGYKDSAASSS
eukprot:2821778-Pyramimonas_sp.AAC.1